MTQIALPVEVRPEEVMRKTSLGGSIDLCLELAGLEPKQIQADCGFDKAQFSRWQSGGEGITWPKLRAVMDRCGNDAPVLWMLGQRNYDLHSIRRNRSALERRIEELETMNRALSAALKAV